MTFRGKTCPHWAGGENLSVNRWKRWSESGCFIFSFWENKTKFYFTPKKNKKKYSVTYRSLSKHTKYLSVNLSWWAPLCTLCGIWDLFMDWTNSCDLRVTVRSVFSRVQVSETLGKVSLFSIWSAHLPLHSAFKQNVLHVLMCVCVSGASGGGSWKWKHEVWNRPVLLLWSHGSKHTIPGWDSTYRTHTHSAVHAAVLSLCLVFYHVNRWHCDCGCIYRFYSERIHSSFLQTRHVAASLT